MMILRLMTIVSLFILCIPAHMANNENTLKNVYEWNDLEYEFPNENERQTALRDGRYVPHSGTPIDVGVYYKADGSRKVFVTIPRFVPGVPMSLGVVSDQRGPNGPMIKAYPSYDWHSSHGSKCDGLTSIFRVAVDECDRLWMVDTGRIGNTQHCPPQIVVFNLKNDVLLFRYQVPSSQFFPGMSLFITPIVDIVNGQCNNAKLYVADVSAPGLLVFDAATQSSWRIQNKWMYPDPDFGTFTIASESFNLMDGIFGMSLTPKTFNGERYLFFHALASERENVVPLRLINNSTAWADPEGHSDAFRSIGKRGVQCAAEAMDSKGNLYCCLMDPISIVSWNIANPYKPNFFKEVISSPDRLQFASGMKVVKNRRGMEELWVNTNRFQKIAAGTIDYTQTNFRIMAANIVEMYSPSISAPRPPYGGRPHFPEDFKNPHYNLIFT